MAHETTATRDYVDHKFGPVSGYPAHAADSSIHVSAEDRARWNALRDGQDGQDGQSVYMVGEPVITSEPGESSSVTLHDERTGDNVTLSARNGLDGADGHDGADGTVEFDELTPEQRASLRGPRGVGWFTSSGGTFTGDENSPGRLSGVDFDPDDAVVGDLCLIASSGAIYDCVAVAGDMYPPGDESATEQASSLWRYRMTVSGPKGDTGAPFTYSMFTSAQLESLRGHSVTVKSTNLTQAPGGSSTVVLHDDATDSDVTIVVTNGRDGADGADGEKGDPLRFSDLTPAQKAELKGDPGEVVWGNLTEEQRAALKGDPFTYADFTSGQLAALRGPPGADGTGWLVSDQGEFQAHVYDESTGTYVFDEPDEDESTYDYGRLADVDFNGRTARRGDLCLVTSTRKIYECIAGVDDEYDGEVQDEPLWKFRLLVVAEKGDPGADGADGADGAPGSRWFVVEDPDDIVGTGSDEVLPRLFPASVAADARAGDMTFVSDGRVYRCVAGAGDTYNDVEQDYPLWNKVGDIAGPAGTDGADGAAGAQGPAGPMSTFVPVTGGLDSSVVVDAGESPSVAVENQSSVWLQTGSAFVFPAPTVPAGQLLEYVLYVKATAAISFANTTPFSELASHGYTVYSNHDSLLDNIANGDIIAFTVAQMGSSSNVIVMRAAVSASPVAAPAAQ